MIKVIEASERALESALGINPKLWEIATEHTVVQHAKFYDELTEKYSDMYGDYYSKRGIRFKEALSSGKKIFVLVSEQGLQTQFLALEGDFIVWEDLDEEMENGGVYSVDENIDDALRGAFDLASMEGGSGVNKYSIEVVVDFN